MSQIRAPRAANRRRINNLLKSWPKSRPLLPFQNKVMQTTGGPLTEQHGFRESAGAMGRVPPTAGPIRAKEKNNGHQSTTCV